MLCYVIVSIEDLRETSFESYTQAISEGIPEIDCLSKQKGFKNSQPFLLCFSLFIL